MTENGENLSSEREEISEEQRNLLIGYGDLFSQLLQSERFRELFSLYFTLHKVVDDVDKAVYFQVIENPPEVVAQKMREKMGSDKKIEIVDKLDAKKILKKTKARSK